MSYIVSDYIIAIKNAVKAQRREALLPCSKLTLEVSKVLKNQEILENFKEEKNQNLRVIKATIKYDKRTPRLVDVLLFSKPTLRKYVSAKEIRDLEKRGNKTLIISTSLGVMTGKEAIKKGIGGEVLFAVW